jgi:hypothetical protein
MADVHDTLAEWSSTTASNAPAGASTIGTGLDDNLREIQGVIVRGLSHKGSDIASVAGTTDIGAVEGLMHDITGALAITGLGTVRAGILKILKFEGAATLTHNATSLILPGAADITTADGDVAFFMSEGSGNWRCLAYLPAATAPIAATQAQQETGTTLTRVVVTGRQQFHPSAAKAWVRFNGTGTPAVNASYNVTSITDNGVGDYTINFTTAFSGATGYAAAFAMSNEASNVDNNIKITTMATGSLRVLTWENGAATDKANICATCFGDQ